MNNLQSQFIRKPLFFSHFSHNIRSYFFNSFNPILNGFDSKLGKIGIFLLFSSASHPKVKQFVDMFKYLSDQCHKGNKDYHSN
jgi:hypothetical protein